MIELHTLHTVDGRDFIFTQRKSLYGYSPRWWLMEMAETENEWYGKLQPASRTTYEFWEHYTRAFRNFDISLLDVANEDMRH